MVGIVCSKVFLNLDEVAVFILLFNILYDFRGLLLILYAKFLRLLEEYQFFQALNISEMALSHCSFHH